MAAEGKVVLTEVGLRQSLSALELRKRWCGYVLGLDLLAGLGLTS